MWMEFQESDFIEEEFEQEGVEDKDPSQEPIDWDTTPIYDDNVNEEYGLHPIFSGLCPNEDDQLEDEEPMDEIANYEEDNITDDEDLPGKVPNFNGEDVDYVDFLGIDNILNSAHDDYGGFYVDEENYMYTRESIVDPFLSVFIVHGREKERQRMANQKYYQVVCGAFPTNIWVC